MKPKYKIIKVVVEEQYLIEMHNNEITCINGWTIAQVIKEWFKWFSMGQFHASREAHLIGNSRKYISSTVEDVHR